MRSYFGGLLCVDWSPDSLFVVTGGQDDLITIWSVRERAVICRGQGHKSWISMVRFDPFMCPSVACEADEQFSIKNLDIDGSDRTSITKSISSPESFSNQGLKTYR